MLTMFTVIIGGMKAGECLTFQEAYRELHERMISACKLSIPQYELAASSCIKYCNPFDLYNYFGDWFIIPHDPRKMYFNQARYFARELGLLNQDDELQESCRFITLLELDEAFSLADKESRMIVRDLVETVMYNPNDPT